MIRAMFTLCVLLCLAMAGRVFAETYPTGPFPTESDYQAARTEKTTILKPNQAVGLINAVEFQIVDEVTDGCWTNVGAVQARVRAELERSNIAVYEERLLSNTPQNPFIVISGLGMKAGSVCVGSFNIRVGNYNYLELGSLAWVGQVFKVPGVHIIWEKSSIATNARNLDETVMKHVQQWIDELVGDRAAATRTEEVRIFRSKWPNSKVMTVREFDELLKK